MKKAFKVLIFIVILVLIVFVGIYFKNNSFGKEKLNIGKEKLRLVVIGIWDFQEILAVDENGNLLRVQLKELKLWNEMDKFERGQEIEIYYDGVITETYPGKITNVSSYKILKEKSDIEIPEEVKKRYDNSTANVMVHVRNISNEKLEFRILDTNEISYKYDFDCSLSKKNEEKNIFEKIEPTVNITMDEVIEIVDSTPGHFDMEGKIDWTDIYGMLNPGEYQFILKNKEREIHFEIIEFNFVVEENGKAICNPPEFGW